MTKRQKPDAGHPEPKSPRTKFDEMSLDAKINRAGAKIIRQREAKGLPSIADALQKNLSTNIGAAPYTHTPALSHTALCESLFRLSPDYAEEFRLSGNPLFALIAISVWPRTKPLPEAIYGYLQEACRKIGATAYDVAAGRTKPGNAPKKVLEAFALAGRQGRSASAFADFKLHMEGLAVSERVDMSDEKSDAILHDIGQEYAAENRSGGSRSQLHRKLKRGREAGEAEPVRKPRVRVRRKPGVL